MNDTTVESTEEKLAKIPVSLAPLWDMTSPDEVRELFTKPFVLFTKDNRYACEGSIEYRWKPSVGVYFSGVVRSAGLFSMEYTKGVRFGMEVEGAIVGKLLLTGINIASDSGGVRFTGQILGRFDVGDINLLVDVVRFDVPNLGAFIGSTVKQGAGISNARLRLEDEEYIIYIDQVENFSQRYRQVVEKGGHIVTACGSIEKKNGRISLEEASNVGQLLHYFLSFVNGRRTGAIFMSGIVGGIPCWTQYAAANIQTYKSVFSWRPQLLGKGMNELWRSFSRLLKNEGENDWLTYCIYWYVEANGKAGGAEAAILIVQCALELLSNWFLEESGRILNNNNFNRKSAAGRIRSVLSELNIGSAIPANLTQIRQARKGWDGPAALVSIRNSLVHSRADKRKELRRLSPAAFAEILSLGTFYLELILLKLLDYKGKMFDRTIVNFEDPVN